MMYRKFLIAAFFLIFTQAAQAAQVEQTTQAVQAVEQADHPKEISPFASWLSQEEATGDWCHSRTKLEDWGVTISSNYTTDILGNPVGGLMQKTEYAGFLDISVAFDFEKFASLKGLALSVGNYVASGRNLSGMIGAYYTIQEIYTSGNYYFGELNLSQSLFDEKLIIEAGRLFAGDVFATCDLWQYYVNSAVNSNPEAILNNIFFPTFRTTAWATRATCQPNKNWQFIAGAYNADERVSKPVNHGTFFSFAMNNGCLLIGQATYKHHHRREEEGYPGSVSCGYYCQTSKFQELTDSTKYKRGNHGAYLIFDQMIYKGDWPEFKGPHYLSSEATEAERIRQPYLRQITGGADRPKGLSIWAAGYLAPQEHINAQVCQLAAGATYQGLPPARDHDMTAFCFIFGKFSDDLEGQSEEIVFEFNHRFQLSPWFYITPDIQYIVNPNGRKDVRDALVLGFEASVDF